MTTISIVTGGSRGLGRNTAISIAKHGGDVILTYRNGADEATAVVAEIESLGRKAVALQLDVGIVSRVSCVRRKRSVGACYDLVQNELRSPDQQCGSR